MDDIGFDHNQTEIRPFRVVERELSFSDGICLSNLDTEAGRSSNSVRGERDYLLDSSFSFGLNTKTKDVDWKENGSHFEFWRDGERQNQYTGLQTTGEEEFGNLDLGFSVDDREQALELQTFPDSKPQTRSVFSKKSSNGNIDNQCASFEEGVDDKIHIEEFKLNQSSILRTIIRTFVYIILWYTFSTSLTLYNKLLLGDTYGKFPAPLMMNTIHFTMQALISNLMVRKLFPALAPSFPMSWRDYFVRVVPTGIATALDIDLTNASLIFITVSFETMCKSAAPIFLLIFAFIFKLEVPSFKLFGIMLIISTGVMLAVTRETEFNLSGFILVMLAALMSGFRWTVTQLLLQKEEYGLNNPFAAMSYLTPVMAIVTAGFSLISEPWGNLRHSKYFDTPHHILGSLLLMLLGGSLAFFMVLVEYILISETSAVTMTVAGVVKEVVTIIVSVIYFGDNFTLMRGIGLAIIVVGVSLFNWFRYQKLVGEHRSTSNNETKTFAYTVLVNENIGGDESSKT